MSIAVPCFCRQCLLLNVKLFMLRLIYMYKVTNSLCGNVLIVTFVKEETASLNSFIVRDVGVQ